MEGFLSFVVRGRVQASLIAAACLVLPLASVVSGAIVALVTLRHGPREGLAVLAMTTAGAGAVSLVLVGGVDGVAAFALLVGVPVVALGAVLRASGSQGLALAAAGAIGGAALTVLHLAAPDPASWWRGVLEATFGRRLRDAGANPEAVERMIEFFAPNMSMSVAWFVVVVLGVLLLGRWAHARLDNPGGFGREFRALRLDRRVSYAAVVVAGLAALEPELAGGLPGVLLYLLIVLHGVQGIAIAHWFVDARSVARGWLAAMYLALVLVPRFIVPLAVTGLSDTWMDWRGRAGRAGSGQS